MDIRSSFEALDKKSLVMVDWQAVASHAYSIRKSGQMRTWFKRITK